MNVASPSLNPRFDGIAVSPKSRPGSLKSIVTTSS
jgi:hypothetical protein